MKTILSLITIITISFGSLPAFAESNPIIVNLDKPVYQQGDSMLISGTVQEIKMPVIALRIFDPNGIILSANNIELKDNNTFSKVIFLDLPFYEETGEYTARLDYGKDTVELNFKIDNGTVEEPENIIDEIIPEIILMESNQTIYYDDDFIEITGKVSAVDDPSILIGIFDTFGMPAGFYFGEINSENKFSISFLAKSGVNFKTEGTYSAKAFYGDSEFKISFDFSNIKP
ncbi:MAG: tetratricopeptide repeat protein, partial [Nitrosopumilaceae archaeon]